MATSTAAAAPIITWKIDPAHTAAEFKVTQPPELIDGYFEASETPGLGIPFDWNRLRAFKVCHEN